MKYIDQRPLRFFTILKFMKIFPNLSNSGRLQATELKFVKFTKVTTDIFQQPQDK